MTRIIFLFVVFSLILWYFHIDVRGFIDSHAGIREAAVSITNFVASIWNNYLAAAVSFIWNNILIGIIWKGVVLPLLSMARP